MGGTRKALVYSFAERYGAMVLDLLSAMVLARLLTPAEIGVFSIAAAMVAIAHQVRDFGIPTYIVQEPELGAARLQTAFALMLAIGAALGALLLLAAPLVASFYGARGVGEVVVVLALNFFLLPFGAITQAVLRREMQLQPIFLMNVASVGIGAITSIGLAALGIGYLSLAWGSFAAVLSKAVLSYFFRPDTVLLRPRFIEPGRVFRTSTRVSLAFVVQQAGSSGTEMIVGRLLGFTNAGFFSRAQGLASLADTVIVSAVRGVALPLFADELRRRTDLAPTYLRGVSYLSVASWSMLALLAVAAEPAIDLLFGDQWVAAAPTAQALCFGMAIATITRFSVSALLGAGASGAVLRFELIVLPLRLTLVAVGAMFGLVAVAVAFGAAEAVAALLAIREVRRASGVTTTRLANAVGRSLVVVGAVALSAGLGLTAADRLGAGSLGALVLASLAAAAGSLVAVIVVRHPVLAELTSLRRLFR